MKKLNLIIGLLIAFCGAAGAQTTYPVQDTHGNHYKKQENLFKDTDKDGVINLYDQNDRNPNVNVYKPAPSVYTPTPAPSTSSTRVVQTGPRGGQYYINDAGNKVYLKKD